MREVRRSASIGMAIALALACFGNPAFAQSSSGTAKPLLRYVVFPAPPFMIGVSADQGALSGIDVDIVREIAGRLGFDLRFIRATWARALELMRQGEADLLSSAFKTPEREAFMSYLGTPYLTSLPIGFYTWTGSGIEVRNYDDLAKARSIGVLNDASYFDRFDHDRSLPKVRLPSQDQLFPMLANRRIDLVAGYVDTENYRLFVEGYRGRVTQMPYLVDTPVAVYMALSKASPLAARLAEFDAVNEGLLREGLIQKTIESYKHRYR